MKKAAAMIVSLLILGSVAIPTALAQVNPQQRGHIAYLESLHPRSEVRRILQSYGRSSLDVLTQNEKDIQKTEDAPISTVWRPGDYGYETPEPVWSNLRPGDYFVTGGRRYYVARITTVANAPVLVAFLVTEGGQVIDTTPRYFYL